MLAVGGLRRRQEARARLVAALGRDRAPARARAHRRPQPQHARGGHAGLRRVGRLRRRPAARRRLPGQLQDVPFPVFRDRTPPVLHAGGKRIPVLTLRYSGPGRATAPVALVGLACSPAELRRARGRIAIAARGRCPFRAKARNAEAAGASGLVVADPRSALPSGGSLIRPGLEIPAVSAGAGALKLTGRARLAVDTVAENRLTRNVIAEQPGRRAAGRDGRRPPRLRARGAGHQRQRQRGGGHARAGRAPAQPARAAVRVLGRRGARALRLAPLRRLAQPRRAPPHHRLPQPRHARLAQRRPLPLRRRPRARRARQGAARAQAPLRDDQHRRRAPTTRRSPARASPPPGCTRARRSARPRARRACSAAAPAGRSTPATTSAAMCSTGSTATS